jgi:ketosteroid isomerase-like protein
MNQTISCIALLLATQFAFAAPVTPAEREQATRQIEQLVGHFQQYVIAKDGKALSALFLPADNSWLTVLSEETYAEVLKKRPDARRTRASTYQQFADYVSASKEPIEEKFSNVQIATNGSIASVYFDFDFIDNGRVANRGSESWHLVRTEDGWKISSMIYSVGR